MSKVTTVMLNITIEEETNRWFLDDNETPVACGEYKFGKVGKKHKVTVVRNSYDLNKRMLNSLVRYALESL